MRIDHQEGRVVLRDPGANGGPDGVYPFPSPGRRDGSGSTRRISALWAAMLLLFAYGDIFGFLVPGRIDEIARGEISGIEITQAFLLAVSITSPWRV